MSLHLCRLLLAVSVTTLASNGLAMDPFCGTGEEAIREVLAKFGMGDPGWRFRMQALVRVTTAGADAVPVLIEALETGTPPVREFAAHALSIIADPRSERALTRALGDPDRGVRIYAVRALSGLGRLKLTDDYRKVMTQASSNWEKAPWMDDYLIAAEDPRHVSSSLAKRRVLLDYDPSKIDTVRLGCRAPDFVLRDRDGNDVRLSDFRGNAAVVLEFNDGIG